MNANPALGQGLTVAGLIQSLAGPNRFLLVPDADQAFAQPLEIAFTDETMILENSETVSLETIAAGIRVAVTGWITDSGSVLKPIVIEIERGRVRETWAPVAERRVSPTLAKFALLGTVLGASLFVFYAWRSPAAESRSRQSGPADAPTSETSTRVRSRTAGPYLGGRSMGAPPPSPNTPARPAELYHDIMIAFEYGLQSALVRLDEPEDIALFRKWLLKARVLGRRVPGALFVESVHDDGMTFRYRLTDLGKTQGHLTWRLIGEDWCLIDVEPPGESPE